MYGYAQPYAYPPAYPPAYPVRRTAPASVHLVAAMQYLGGALAWLLAAFAGYLAVVSGRTTPHPDTDFIDPQVFAAMMAIAAGVCGLSGLVAFLLGRKLQRGREWARIVLILLNVLSAAAIVAGFATGARDLTHLVALVVPALYLVLLNTSAARAWCRGA